MGCAQSSVIEVDVKDEGQSSAEGWRTYVDDQLVAQGCDWGLIVGLDRELWAKSPSVALKRYEAAVLADDGTKSKVAVDELMGLADFARTAAAPSAGLRVDEVKYVILRAEKGGTDLPLLVYGRAGKQGLALAAARTCVVVGGYNEGRRKAPTYPGACNKAVEALARYLVEQGY